MSDALLALFTVVGAVTTTIGTVAAAYYIVTRRPTPNGTVREVLTSIRWSYALALFILPCTFVGWQDGTPVTGFLFGAGFVAFLVGLQWWFGPI